MGVDSGGIFAGNLLDGGGRSPNLTTTPTPRVPAMPRRPISEPAHAHQLSSALVLPYHALPLVSSRFCKIMPVLRVKVSQPQVLQAMPRRATGACSRMGSRHARARGGGASWLGWQVLQALQSRPGQAGGRLGADFGERGVVVGLHGEGVGALIPRTPLSDICLTAAPRRTWGLAILLPRVLAA